MKEIPSETDKEERKKISLEIIKRVFLALKELEMCLHNWEDRILDTEYPDFLTPILEEETEAANIVGYHDVPGLRKLLSECQKRIAMEVLEHELGLWGDKTEEKKMGAMNQ